MDFVNQPTYFFIKDLITFILTIAGIIVASGGLSTWRKQIEGKKKIDVSYNLNYSILKLRDAIKHVRNPGIWNAENHKAIQYFNNNKAVQKTGLHECMVLLPNVFEFHTELSNETVVEKFANEFIVQTTE